MASANSSAASLEAGAARAIITPPVGIRMIGYTVQECASESIERELTATALVLTDGRLTVALLACDLVFILEPHATEFREHIGARLGIPADNVLINCSHTHLGPMMFGWQPGTPDQDNLQHAYLATLKEQLTGVAAMADARKQPARIGAGEGHAPIGINRRERLADGRVVIGENPAGAVDHQVNVIRVDDLAGRPLATVMCAAAHTVVLGPKTAQLSPDYVGPAREIVERATGALSLFFQGAAGNVNPRCGIGTGGAEQYDDLERLGAMLGGEVLKTWAQIRTHNRHGPRRIVQSVATVSVWDYVPTEAGLEHFSLATRRVTLPLAPLPQRNALEHAVLAYRAQLADAVQSGASIAAQNVARKLLFWAETALAEVSRATGPATRDLSFWALRVNDLGIVAVSGEPFAELSLEVKRRSPLAHTVFLGYSNGCLAYLPTPEAFAEGGMEVVESCKNYLLPAGLTPDWGPKIVDTSLDLLSHLP